MKSSRRTALRLTFLALLGGLFLAPEPAAVKAEGLKEFTGYTRPGTPDDRIANGKIIYAALEKEGKNGIGGTVYYMVLELGQEGRARGEQGDFWGAGFKDSDKTFQPGIDLQGASSPKLDTRARYLYLYQVINDRKTLTPIQSESVRLFVPPTEITSWGHFPNLGFAIPAKNKGVMTPVSAVIQGVADTPEGKIYRDRAPHIPAPVPFGVKTIAALPVKPMADGREKDPPREPDHVMIVASYNARDGDDVEGREVVDVPVMEFNAYNPLMSSSRYTRQRSNYALVATWNRDNLLKPTERSPIFGFTSDLPPTFAPTRMGGPINRNAIRPVGGDGAAPSGSAVTLASGSVPTPEGAPAVAGGASAPIGGVLGSLGGTGGGIGGGGGFGFPGASVGALGTPGLATATPGGSIGTTGGTGQQQQTPSNQTQNVNVNQNQNQQQQQQQQQQQTGGEDEGGGHVVPEPPAAILALLGLPFLFLLLRKKPLPGGAAA